MFVIKNPENIKQMFNYCIVIFYTDQFYIQFDLVRIRDLWNVNYVNMSSSMATSSMLRENCLHWLSCIALHCVISGLSKLKKALGSQGVIWN